MGRPPSTTPALASLSAIVSKIFLVSLVWGHAFDPSIQDLGRRHHKLGGIQNFEHRAVWTSHSAFMMKAGSTSIRVAMKRSVGTKSPSLKNMSSSSTPESGSSI